MSTSALFLGVLFGAIGLGFFIYGRKQRALVPFVSGIGLMLLPYFIGNPWLLVAVCAALIALPWFWRP